MIGWTNVYISKTRGSINNLIQFQCSNKPTISFVLFPMVINVALGKFVLLSYKWSMRTNIFCRHLPKKKNLVVIVNIFQLSNDRYIKSRTWSYWITEFVFNLLFHHMSSIYYILFKYLVESPWSNSVI